MVFDLSIADLGDLDTTPGNAERTAAQIAEQLEPIVRAGARRSRSAATTRSCSASCAPTPPSTARSESSCSTPTPTPGSSTTASATSTARRSSARMEEGLIDPHRSLLAGMRGSLYAASDLDEPREWGFEIVPCDELRTWTPGAVRRAGA